jgi:hypothetical protein
MGKRTSIKDYQEIEHAEDLDRVVKDKRVNKRASKQKKHRRNRHYVKTLLRHLSEAEDNGEY